MRVGHRAALPAESAPMPADSVGFDPGAHTVAEVLAYLEEHPEDLEQVTQAELDGKARTTLLTQLGT